MELIKRRMAILTVGFVSLIIISIGSLSISLSSLSSFDGRKLQVQNASDSVLALHLDVNRTTIIKQKSNESAESTTNTTFTKAPNSPTFRPTHSPKHMRRQTNISKETDVVQPTTNKPSLIRNYKYPNIAIQDLYEQHDRLLLRAKNFYNQLDQNATLREQYARKEPQDSMQKTKPICLVVMTSNRDVPYIDLLVYMLTQRQSYEEIFSLAEVHVMNIEQRVDRQDRSYLNNIRKIGFVRYSDFAKDNITPGEKYSYSQRKAGYRAMQTCVESNSKWCVILEDDALPPARFFPLFRQHVMIPLRDKEQNYATIRLYYSFIDELAKGTVNIHDDNWVNTWYKKFRKERKIINLENAHFSIPKTGITYGGVALAFPKSSYNAVIATYDALGLNKTTENNDVILGHYFPRRISKPQGVTDPSLITHIGLMSENDKRRDFSRIYADVRFQTNLDV